ncbi:LAME_0F10308g1_1 [Lachancea meyersii CBS 8951]|uniref:LAME_0F10308g1_1 n=1 Tax=Lachancea meyersii CBS 8951 TaxID=1266667 RepID=A0A1G4JVD9_9SACH|nr:LAME_0F10308g1_1 [Lachancea meyersii CBS 8951]
MSAFMKLKPTLPVHNAVKAIVFDMDGTLSVPQTWMFKAMRDAIGLRDPHMDILTFVDELPSQKLRDEANMQIKNVEARAMAEMQPQPGLVALLKYLTVHGVSTSICTRNLIKPVRHLILKFVPEECDRFDHILTREFRPTKPSPDPLLHIAGQLDIKPKNMIMVGDSYDDMACGRAAGCATILVRNETNGALFETWGHLIDAAVQDLAEIIDLVENGFSKRDRN